MKDNLKQFLKFASENDELAGKFDEIKDETDKGKVIDFAIKEAKAHGFELTAEDFAHSEMDDDELEAVAGGGFSSEALEALDQVIRDINRLHDMRLNRMD